MLFGVSATIISLTLGAMKAARRFLAHFARMIAQFAGRRSGIVNKSPILNAHGKEINFQIAEKVVLGWWSLAFSEVCPSTISGDEVQQVEELVFPWMFNDGSAGITDISSPLFMLCLYDLVRFYGHEAVISCDMLLRVNPEDGPFGNMISFDETPLSFVGTMPGMTHSRHSNTN